MVYLRAQHRRISSPERCTFIQTLSGLKWDAGCGPFKMSASAADHEPPSPTLFMDRAGSAHRSLGGGLLEAKRSSSPNVHAPVMDCSVGFSGGLGLPSSTR